MSNNELDHVQGYIVRVIISSWILGGFIGGAFFRYILFGPFPTYKGLTDFETPWIAGGIVGAIIFYIPAFLHCVFVELDAGEKCVYPKDCIRENG